MTYLASYYRFNLPPLYFKTPSTHIFIYFVEGELEMPLDEGEIDWVKGKKVGSFCGSGENMGAGEIRNRAFM